MIFDFLTRSISRRLIFWFILISLVPILFFGFLTTNMFVSSLEKEIFSKLINTSNLKSKQLDLYFDDLGSILLLFQNDELIIDNLPLLEQNLDKPTYFEIKKNIDNHLKKFVDKKEIITDIFLLDKNKNIVYTSFDKHQFLLGDNFIFSKSFLSKIGSEITFSNVFQDNDNFHDSVMHLGTSVNNSDGELVGFIITEVNVSYIFDLIQEPTGLGQTGEILIGQRDGNYAVFISPLKYIPSAQFNTRISLDDSMALPIREAVQRIDGHGKTFDYRNEPILAVWQYIPDAGWGMVTKIDQTEAFLPIDLLAESILIFTFPIIIAVCFIAYIVSKTISKPILQLDKNMQKVWKNSPITMNISGDDELSHLVVSFNELSSQLTQSKKLVQEQSAKLIKNERFLAMGELSARIAHDLRNPLSVIKNIVYLFESSKNPEISKYILPMNKSIERMEHQINDVLNFAKNKPPSLAKYSISGILKDSIQTQKIPDNIKVTVMDSDTKVMVDSIQLESAFSNIIRNSIESIGDEKGIITITITEKQNDVVIEIVDSGILNADINRIFEPLYTTKMTGTGLGLASCKSIIENHDTI